MLAKRAFKLGIKITMSWMSSVSFAITHPCVGLTGLERAAEPVPHKETLWLEAD